MLLMSVTGNLNSITNNNIITAHFMKKKKLWLVIRARNGNCTTGGYNATNTDHGWLYVYYGG